MSQAEKDALKRKQDYIRECIFIVNGILKELQNLEKKKWIQYKIKTKYFNGQVDLKRK